MSRKLRRLPRRSAFTLIEVLVATTMFVLVLSAVYATFRVTSDAATRTQSRADVSQTARVILVDIATRLNAVYPMPLPSSEGQFILFGDDEQDFDDQSELDVISFVTTVVEEPVLQLAAGEQTPSGPYGTNSRPVLTSGFAQTTYRLQQDEQGNRLLIRESLPLLGSSQEQTPPQVSVLSDRVRALNFQYYDPDAGEWLAEWGDRQDLPQAIAVQIAIQSDRDKEKVEKFSRVILLQPVTRLSTLPRSKAPTPLGSQSGGSRASGGRGQSGRGEGGRGEGGRSGERSRRGRDGETGSMPGPQMPGSQMTGPQPGGGLPGMMPGGPMPAPGGRTGGTRP